MEKEMLKGKVAAITGAGCGMRQTMAEQDLILNLQAAGFDSTLLEEFLVCWKNGKTAEQLQLLSRKRAGLLDQVHQEERQIHCLDYLVYQIEKSKNP